MDNTANQLVHIENGYDYHNKTQRPIYAIHCIHTNECDVTIKTIENSVLVFPPKSFIQGAVYNINIRSIEFQDGYAAFVGYIK